MFNIDLNLNKIIFNNINNNNKLKEIINNNLDFNFNIKNNKNIYLIEYLILNNNYEILNLLFNKTNINIDILDIEERNILFIPIKFNKLDILKLILKKNVNNIGLSLLDQKDIYGLYPLHYAINFKNIDIINEILNYIKNYNNIDTNGYTYLHYAIKIKNIKILKLILSYKPNINYQTLSGDTALHLACNYNFIEGCSILIKNNIDVNIYDYNTQITALIYSILLNNYKLFQILIDKSDINYMDQEGNTALHYIAMDTNYKMLQNIILKANKFNLSNLKGQIPLHILLYKHEKKILDLDIDLIKIINNSNLNIQDNKGNSCFYLIVYYDIWEILFNTIKLNKLNAFIINKNVNIIDLISEEKKKKFIDLLTESYLIYLRKNKHKWINKLDTLCLKKLPLNQYKNKNKKKFTNNKDICYDLIKDYIKKNKISIPIKNRSYYITFDHKNHLDFVSYTGDIIDILFGLFYLHDTFNNITTTLNLKFNENKKLENYYINKQNKVIYTKDFLNIEIIWNNQHIFFPTELDHIIKKFKKSKNKRFLIIPIGLELSYGSHANILLYDKKLNEIERFEPHGSIYPFRFNYNPELLDTILFKYFNNYFCNLKYFKPLDYLPKLGFQYLESNNNNNIGDPGGFCASWSIWYINLRIKYNNIDRKKIVIKSINKIKELNFIFKTIIRNFSYKITSNRDIFLSNHKLTINNWKNYNFTNNKISNIIKNLKIIIKNYI